MLSKVKNNILKLLFNKISNNLKIYPDGSIVEYNNGELKILAAPDTTITFCGKLNLLCKEDIVIQSEKVLYLRGDILHLNDNGPPFC